MLVLGSERRYWEGCGDTSRAKVELAASEAPIEIAVSEYLGRLPFLWLAFDDEPGSGSLRGYIERHTIALTNSLDDPIIDLPSPSWLGYYSGGKKVRRSGLWNERHVDENYEPRFLDVLETAIKRGTVS